LYSNINLPLDFTRIQRLIHQHELLIFDKMASSVQLIP